MSVRDVESWLRALGLERYAEAFHAHNIDLETLPSISDGDLKEIGIRSLGHRKKLLGAIADLSPNRGIQLARSQAMEPEGERRTVTVLFCDIAEFTRLSGERDAEEIHTLLNEYFETVDSIVQIYGGHVDKHIGDAVMAIFGAPVAHTNDPERAVRAAFDIHKAVTRLSRPVEVHMGLASGSVVASRTGSHTHRQYTVTGPAVSLAARLQDLAATGQILVSDSVYRSVAQWVHGTAVDQVTVKGSHEPVRAWRLHGLRTEAALGPRTALVGRRAELETFADLLARCARDRKGQVLYLCGEAGIGKTRLVEEFRARALMQGFACHTGLVLDFGDGGSHSAISDLMCSLLGLRRTSTTEMREDMAQRALTSGLLMDHRDVYLHDLLDLPHTALQRTRYHAMPHEARSRGKRETLLELVAARALAQPQLLVIEDVHWADSDVMAYIEHLGRSMAGVPVLLVITSRIQGHRLARLQGDPRIPLAIMALSPLAPEEAMVLAHRVVDAHARLVQVYVERSGGNPLFLEQLLRNQEELPRDAVPDSIQSIVQARLDGLDPTDKHALQAASVMGQRVSLGALRFLLDDPNYTCDKLVDHYLLQPIGEGEYLFAHALVLESVYASLLRSRLQVLHARAAQWFRDRSPALHAEHLDRAGDPGAVRAYLDAAERLAGEYRFERALGLCERGLALLASGDSAPSQTTEQALEHALTYLRGEILYKLGAMSESLASFERAEALAISDIERCQVWLRLAEGLRTVDRIEEALYLLERAQRLAEAHGLVDKLAAIHHLHGNLLFPRGDLGGCLEQHLRARDYAARAGSAELEARALSGLGDAYYMRGQVITGHHHYDRCIALCREHGFMGIEAANLSMRGITSYFMNRLVSGLDDSRQAAALAAMIGDKRAEIVARCGVTGIFLVDMDRWREAHEELEMGIDLARSIGARRFEALALIYLGKLVYYEGDRQGAKSLLIESLARGRETGFSFVGPTILGALALVTDQPAERRRALAEAEEILDAGAIAFNHLFFYADAMDTCLDTGDIDRVEHYADALAAYTRVEPVPWSELVIARGRALAAYARGVRTDALAAELGALHAEARDVGLIQAAKALGQALGSFTGSG